MEPHVESVIRKSIIHRSKIQHFSIDVKAVSKETVFRCNQAKVLVKHNQKVILHLLVKTPPEDKETRAIQKTGAKFSNEILFYKEVYPRLKKYGWNGKVPVLYGSSMERSKEVIVMEDLESEGYLSINVAVGLDDEHCKVVLENLAELHGASMEWKTKDVADYNRIKGLIKDATILDIPDESELTMQKIIVDSALEAGQTHSSFHFGREFESKMTNMKTNIYNDVRSWIKSENDRDLLINGNPWINCFMFKLDKVTKKPASVAMVDWQNMRFGSCFMDLAVSILSSASSASLAHCDSLLKLYKSPLQEVDVKTELQFVGKFGLTMALINVLFASVEDEIPLEQIIKGILRSPQLREEGFKRLTIRVGAIVKAAADTDMI